MASIYTCPQCRRRYTIHRNGDYLCDCGRNFSYPPILSMEKANFIALSPVYVDSASRSVRRSSRTNPRPQHLAGGRDCPLARVSLICGILGLLFFGIPSLPGLLCGVAALLLIADPFYNYRGNGLAVAGIALSLVGAIAWGAWLCIGLA